VSGIAALWMAGLTFCPAAKDWRIHLLCASVH
jgi:hypothetical protein